MHRHQDNGHGPAEQAWRRGCVTLYSYLVSQCPVFV